MQEMRKELQETQSELKNQKALVLVQKDQFRRLIGLVNQEVQQKYVTEINRLRQNIIALREKYDLQIGLRLKEARKLHS